MIDSVISIRKVQSCGFAVRINDLDFVRSILQGGRALRIKSDVNSFRRVKHNLIGSSRERVSRVDNYSCHRMESTAVECDISCVIAFVADLGNAPGYTIERERVL